MDFFRIIGVFVLFFGCGCSVTGTEYSERGLYLGASVVGLIPNFDDTDGADLDGGDITPGVGARLGYRFLNHFAIEGGYEYYGEIEMDNRADVEIQNFLLTGKIYPFTGSLQPYGLLGVALQDTSIDTVDFDETDPAARLGLGLEWYLINKVPLFAEVDYRVPGGDSDDLQYATLQLGAMIRF